MTERRSELPDRPDRRGSLGKIMDFGVNKSTYLYNLLEIQMSIVDATEAATFLLIGEDEANRVLEKVVHIRDDDPTAEQLENSAKEFQRVAQQGIDHMKHCALPLEEIHHNELGDFVIALLFYNEAKMAGVSCFVVLDINEDIARVLLERARAMSGYFEFYMAAQKLL